MAFQATPAWTGVPTFNIVHIDPNAVAKAFQTYLETGSKLTGVDLDDIDTTVIQMPSNAQTVTLSELISLGMKMFDAVVWLTSNRPISHPLHVSQTMKKSDIPSMHEIARSVFYCYFMLLVQARYPAGRTNKDKPKIPNFLTTLMGMSDDQEIYVEKICTFEPSKFDPKWAKYVAFPGFGQESLSRFGLGVAGYRLFGPFKLYKPKEGYDHELARAVTFAQTVATSRASWDVHPLTRDPAVLTRRGNLNKNLGNLMLDVFTEEQLQEMVKTKILFKMPVREANHREYLQWKETDDITGTAYIFTI